MHPNEHTLTETLVRMTAQRDALLSLLELTPDSHRQQLLRVLEQMEVAIDGVTAALDRWLPK